MADARSSRRLEEFARRARDRPTLRRLDAAAVEAIRELAAADVDALLLKGPVLARALYGPDEHRAYSDVDLLVAPDRVEAARVALSGLGYANVRERLGIDEEVSALKAETWSGVGGTPRDGVMIDLHWQLEGSEAPAPVAWEALQNWRESIEIDGQRVATLGAPGLAMHVAIHMAQHGPGYPKPHADLARALERWPLEVWRDASGVARELQAVTAFATGLRLAAHGPALADELGLPAGVDAKAGRPRGTFHLDALGKARTPRERVSVLRRSLLPRREWIAWQYPWARSHGPRLVAGYVVHLSRVPVWALRAWRYRRR